MALNTQISNAAASAACNALAALLNGGTLNVYAGSQPANANTAITGQTLLATLSFNATAFASAVNGVATANAITSATAVATGTASFFRCEQSGGAVVYDGTIGTSGANLNLNSTAISSGATVAVSSLTFTINEAGS